MFPKDPASLKAVLAKTAADQLVWAPVMTCVFFAVLKTLEGHPEMIMSTIEVGLCPAGARMGNLGCAPPVCSRLLTGQAVMRSHSVMTIHRPCFYQQCHCVSLALTRPELATMRLCRRRRVHLREGFCRQPQAKLVPTIVANYVLWPAAHFVNFRFVPTEHRILYNNCVSVRRETPRRALTVNASLEASGTESSGPASVVALEFRVETDQESAGSPSWISTKLLLRKQQHCASPAGHMGADALPVLPARVRTCLLPACCNPG